MNQCEIQNNFQFLSQKNSETNGIKNNLYKDDFINCDFNKQFTKESKAFDYIVSNPPFYHSDVIKSENKSLKIARYNDSMPLDKFIRKTAKILKQNGKFFFCYDAKQLDKIIDNIDKTTLNIESIQFLHPNLKKEASLVMVYCRNNSKSKLKILPPLIMFDTDNKFTQEVEDIYTKCATYSIKCEVK